MVASCLDLQKWITLDSIPQADSLVHGKLN